MLVRHRDGRSAKEGLVAVVLLAGLAGSADALPFNQQQTQPQPTAAPDRPATHRATRTAITTSRDKSAGKESPEALAPKAKGLLSIYIAIDKQQLTLYSDGQPIAHSRVSTGVPGHPTPTGVFSIIQKDRYHHSNIYSNAPMYFMQRITWSGVAMHQGVVPNHPASHGCIRLPEAFARQLWGITRLGVRVIVARGEVTPVAIEHPRLFTFKPAPPPEPAVGPLSNVQMLLNAAGQSLATGQTGTADEALEQAETRILTRTVPQTQTNYASQDPVVAQIQQARYDLGTNDRSGALQMISQILNSNAPELSD